MGRSAATGIRLSVIETGSGVPLLLLPGGPGLANYLLPLAELLDPPCRVILPDLRGTGGSEAVLPYEVSTFIADLERLRQELELSAWAVGGHSFGADLSLAYALEHPSTTTGVLSISGTGVQDDRQWHAAYEAGRAAGRDPDHLGETPFNAEVQRAGLASWRTYIKQSDLLRRIATLSIPVLAIHGSEDVRPRWPAEQVIQLLLDGRMVVVEGAGHWPWVTHPMQTQEAGGLFLQSLLHSAG